MIDNIKITIQNFSGNFNKCKLVFTKGNVKYFHLQSKNKNPLYLIYKEKGKELIIRNSIRKWYFKTPLLLRDLNKDQAIEAYHLIANDLNISFDELTKSTFTNCEIGLILKLSVPIFQFIPMIVKYSTYKRVQIANETVYFIGSDRKLIFYDKTKEIEDTNELEDSRKYAFQRFRDKEVYFVRAELKMKDNQAFVNKNYKYETLGDLLNNYLDLYYILINEINRVILLNKLTFPDSMNFQEYLIARALEADGYLFLANMCNKEFTKPNSKSKMINKVLSVILKFSDRKTYNTLTFKNDIFENIKRLKNREKELDIAKIRDLLKK